MSTRKQERRIHEVSSHIRSAWGICKRQADEEARRIIAEKDAVIEKIIADGLKKNKAAATETK